MKRETHFQIFGPILASSLEAGGDEGSHSNLWPDFGFFLTKLNGTLDFYDFLVNLANFWYLRGYLANFGT